MRVTARLAPVILAVVALATAWVERGNAQHYIANGRYTDDYIRSLV
jgi:hypothetical protein